jgi:uncharacterized protein (TIGR04255 family)
MHPDREHFAVPPVALVTAELRFTDSPRLRQQDTLDAIAIACEHRFPIAEPITGMAVEPTGLGAVPQLVARQSVILRNAESTEALTLTSNSLTYETTAYRDFDDLASVVNDACRTLITAGVAPALTRVGLRYINEVRVREPVSEVRAWSDWIDPRVLGTLSVAPEGVPVRALQAAVSFDLGNGGGLQIGYAAVPQGSVVNHRFLKRPPFEQGPFFAMDFDGFCDFSADPAKFLDPDLVARVLRGVHGPIGEAFQRSLTDNSRSLFRAVPVPGRHSR